MKANLVNTGGCIQNNYLDVCCIALHCIIKVSELGPSWPSCWRFSITLPLYLLQICCMCKWVNLKYLLFMAYIQLFF